MITKEELHIRRIDMRGFRRSDGLYEVEGRVTDRKIDSCYAYAAARELVGVHWPELYRPAPRED